MEAVNESPCSQLNYLIMSGSMMFENILSTRALEWLAILVGCKGINELDASESKNSLVGLCSL